MDVHDSKTRSYNMSCIKGKIAKPEEIVAKYLFSKGFRYRRNVKTLPGSPDIVLKKYNTVIFVNGCFWHMHQGCKFFVWPESNVEFWKEKLIKNKKRDEEKIAQLEVLGWIVIVIWECQLKSCVKDKTLQDLVEEIKEQDEL